MAGREWSLPAFGARVQEHARRVGLAGFWQWWKRQLGPLMPAAPRAALARRRMRPVLVFASDSATLWRLATANGQPVMAVATTIPLTGDAATIAAAGRAALAPLTHAVYGAPASSARVVISLPARDVLRRNIVLPSAVEENFRQALAYDLDRHTPFKPEELYFDATIVARDAVHKTITIDLAAARRAIVDPALRHAAAWGADVVAVVPEPPDRAAGSRLNLLPADARTSSSAWTRWQVWIPISVLAAATLAAVVIPLWQKRDYVMQLNPMADQARRRAAVSETLRAELDARVADYNTALERKYAYPSALQVVDAVSKLLPDDTWLTQFEMKTVSKGKEMQRDLLVRGETANAGRLVQLFEESQLFAQAAPRSPTTKIQPGPGEIFDLGAQLKTRALPAPVTLAVADTTAEAPPSSSAPPAGAPAPGTPPLPPAPPTGAARPAAAPPSTAVPRRWNRAACRGRRAAGIGTAFSRGSSRWNRPCRGSCTACRGTPAACRGTPAACRGTPAACRGTPAAASTAAVDGSAAAGGGRWPVPRGARRTRVRIARTSGGRRVTATEPVVAGTRTGRCRQCVRQRWRAQAMTPTLVARLSPSQQRTAAVALLVAVILLILGVVLAPILLLHRHYDTAIADLTDRLERYRRVAAQAPELRRALELIKEKDGRRFYLKNTAPNLAGAELADLVRAAIENNGGRITTSQNPGPREEGRFRQLTVNVQFFATTPNLARILRALDTQLPYLVVDNLTIRPLNAFRGFRPGPGQEPENNVQLDVSALAYPEASRTPALPAGGVK